MNFDLATQHLLEYQGRRMRAALGACPPDRKEALLIQNRVDDILDRRPRHYAVAVDGEVVWSNSPHSWVADQALPAGAALAVNAAGEPERVLTAAEQAEVDRFSRQLEL